MRGLLCVLVCCVGFACEIAYGVPPDGRPPQMDDEIACTCGVSPLQGGCICVGRDKWKISREALEQQGQKSLDQMGREAAGCSNQFCTCGNGEYGCQCDVGGFGTKCECGKPANDGLGGVPKEVLAEQEAAWEETEHPGWLTAYANWIKSGGTAAEWRDLTPDARKRRADTALATPTPSPPGPPAPNEHNVRARGNAYIGVFVVYAEPAVIGGEAGYSHAYKQGAELDHWLPAAQFEKTFFKIADDGTAVINEDTVDRFILDISRQQLGNRTVAATARTATGFHATKLANAAQTYAFDGDQASRIADDRVRALVWEHLGFVLQWAEKGVSGESVLYEPVPIPADEEY